MYAIQFSAYCGMSWPIQEYDDKQLGRDRIAQFLKHRRKQGYPVATLERGKEWEIQEPEGCMMVPDACGVLSLEAITGTCRWCGSEFEKDGNLDEFCDQSCFESYTS